jgi:hypothetical protein
MRFYVLSDALDKGPYDLISMVKKIRTGHITPQTLVYLENEAPTPAGNHPRLAEFFSDEPDSNQPSRPVPAAAEKPQAAGYLRSIKLGWQFFMRHQSSAVYAAVVVFLALGIGAATYVSLPPILNLFAIFLGWFWGLVGISILQLVVLRLHRGQPVGDWLLRTLNETLIPILNYSFIMTILTIVGGLLFIIPGLFILTQNIFAPYFIAERRMGVNAAMAASQKLIKKRGMDFLGVVFALVTTNIIALFLFIFPVIFTLPITLAALADFYES